MSDLGFSGQRTVWGTVTRYAYDGAQVLTETNGTNIVQRRYVYGPGIDNPLMVLEGSEKKYLHLDGKGSVLAASNSLNAVTNKFTADAWGNGADEATSPYRFTARRVDAETGNYYYRNRYYSARQGRFMSQDPIGYGDGLNMYAYVKNDPVNYSDPMGLSGCTTEDTPDGGKTTCPRNDPVYPDIFDGYQTTLYLHNDGTMSSGNGGSGGGSTGSQSSSTSGELVLDPGISDFVTLMLSIDAPFASDDLSIFEEIVVQGDITLVQAHTQHYGNFSNASLQAAGIKAINFSDVRFDHIVRRHSPGSPDPKAGKWLAPVVADFHNAYLLLTYAADFGIVRPNTQGRPGYILSVSYLAPVGYSGVYRGKGGQQTTFSDWVLRPSGVPGEYNVWTGYPRDP